MCLYCGVDNVCNPYLLVKQNLPDFENGFFFFLNFKLVFIKLVFVYKKFTHFFTSGRKLVYKLIFKKELD